MSDPFRSRPPSRARAGGAAPASSRFRAVVLIAFAVAALATAATAQAQTPPADGAAPAGGGGGTHSFLGPIVNTFFLVVNNVDPITVIVAILSVIGLTLVIQGFLKTRAENYMPEASVQHMRDLIAQRKFKELIEHTENDPSFVARALNPALKRAPSFSSMKEAMETAIGEQTAERFRSIEYLNIIGNLGPLLGLTGTVLGMVQAFSDMQKAQGNASPSELAGGISIALVHTFLGLFLAVPCLAAFGILRTMVDRLTVRAALVCEELLLMVKPQESKPAGAAAGGPPAPRAPGMPPGVPAPGMRKPAVPSPMP